MALLGKKQQTKNDVFARKAPSEAEIEAQCLVWLNSLPGVYAWKNPSAGFFDTKRKTFRKHSSRFAIRGTSDILGIADGGLMFAVEVKAGKNKPTDFQLEFLARIRELRGLGIWVTSVSQLVQEFGKWRGSTRVEYIPGKTISK